MTKIKHADIPCLIDHLHISNFGPKIIRLTGAISL